MQPFRWGILGTARINHRLIPRMREGRHQLVAVASRTKDRADAYAKEWEIPVAFGSYDDLLADSRIDAIYIPLPNALHTEWTIRAVEHGKHVLCEKPLALTLADVDAMEAAARQHERVVAEAFMYRHHPQTLRIRELVKAGTLGEPRFVHGTFSFWLNRDPDVRLDPTLGGGSFWDVGCYPVSMSRYALELEPTEVFAWQSAGPSGVDLLCSAMLRFGTGPVAQVNGGFRAMLRERFEIVGTEATLAVANPFRPGTRERLMLTHGDHEEVIEVEGPALYGGQLDDLASAALEGTPPRITLDDSRRNTRVLLACYRSAATGLPVACADIQ